MTPESLPGPSLIKSVLGHLTISARWMVPGMRSLEGQYGPFFRLRHGIRDIVCVSDPEVAEEFLVRSGDMPKGPSKCPAKLFLGRGLLLSDGAHWRRQRRVMAPYLTPRSVERYSDDIGAVVRDRVADWEDGQHIDVTTEMTEITLRVLSRCLFGDSLPEDGARTVQAILTRALNDVLGKWLCAAPVWSRLPAYRSHHLQHHNYANSPRDPDLGLVTPFPTSKSSVLRKLARDIFGVTGARRVVGLIAMDLGFLTYTASTGAARKDPLAEGGLSLVIKQALHNLGPVLATNAVMAGLLWWAGIGWTFALWVGAYLTTFSLFLRLRALAEHACTSMVENPFWHTRTTKAHAVARLTVAPHNVNYHLEHHLLMTVPHQSLPRMHALLVERGAIPPARLASGYWEVLRQVSAGRGGAPDASPA